MPSSAAQGWSVRKLHVRHLAIALDRPAAGDGAVLVVRRGEDAGAAAFAHADQRDTPLILGGQLLHRGHVRDIVSSRDGRNLCLDISSKPKREILPT